MTDTQRPFLQLAFIGDRNRPGKSDWSGAFKPEAMRYTESAGILHIMSLAQSRETQRQTIEENIARVQPDEVAFFCHGYALKLELGYDTSNVGRLADALAKVGCHRVALYACSTGGHRTKGFAARLRDAMCEAGLDPRIVAHETAVRIRLQSEQEALPDAGARRVARRFLEAGGGRVETRRAQSSIYIVLPRVTGA